VIAMRGPGPEGENVTALSPEKRKRIHDVFDTYESAVNAMEQALIQDLAEELAVRSDTVLRVWNNAYSGVAWDDETVYIGRHRRDAP
jgi:hypothetical protein